MSLLLIVGVIACDGSSSGENDEGEAGFIVSGIHSSACTQETEAECFTVELTNKGSAAGSGACELRARKGSTATFSDGETTTAIETTAPGENVPLLILVFKNSSGDHVVPTIDCEPGAAV